MPDDESSASAAPGVYVYAVLREKAEHAPPEPIRLLDCGGIRVAVRSVAGAPVVDAAGLRAHDAIVRELSEHARSVLPMRFGTIVRDEAALRAWIETVRAILERGLDLVEGREQMVIRVYGEAPAAPGGAPAVRAHAETPAGGESRGTRYLLRLRPSPLPETLAPVLGELRRELEGLVASERIERHETPPLIATLRHLIPREAGDRYRAAVDKVRPALEGFTLDVSGPWPPYAFTPEEVS